MSFDIFLNGWMLKECSLKKKTMILTFEVVNHSAMQQLTISHCAQFANCIYYKPYNVTYQSLEISQQFPFYRRDCCSKIDFLHLWHFGKFPPEE